MCLVYVCSFGVTHIDTLHVDVMSILNMYDRTLTWRQYSRSIVRLLYTQGRSDTRREQWKSSMPLELPIRYLKLRRASSYAVSRLRVWQANGMKSLCLGNQRARVSQLQQRSHSNTHLSWAPHWLKIDWVCSISNRFHTNDVIKEIMLTPL